MEQRKQIEEQLYMELDNINKGFPSNFIEAIMQLIPQWKKFSEDCKPEVGKFYAIRTSEKRYLFTLVEWYDIGDGNFEKIAIEKKYQFIQLPD